MARMTEEHARLGLTAELGTPHPLSNERQILAFTRDRFVDLFLSQSRRAQVGLLLAASLVAWIWGRQTGFHAALWWLACVLLVTLARFRFTNSFVRADEGRSATKRICLLLLANGILMAIPLWTFRQLSDVERAAVSIILLATATASVATTSGYRFVFMAFAAPMLVPLSLTWAFVTVSEDSRWAALGLSLLIFLYLLFLASIGSQASKVFEDSSRFRYGEQELNADLKTALDSASEANRAKTQFLAAASHDLRQPIHSMNVLVAALMSRQLDGTTREIVTLLDSVNQMLSKQLDGLLDISKLDAGIVKPSMEIHRLDRLAMAQLSALAPRATELGLTPQVGEMQEVSALVDEALLSRVIGNLMDNAMKFTPRGGSITLSLTRDGADAVVTVSDTGIGIPASEHERVFHEFYQVGNASRDRSKGLGLGLSIVRRMCDLMGIELRMVSQVGMGTSISLRMAAMAPAMPTQSTSLPAPLADGLRVLVVDDERIVRDSMRLLLSELGCTVFLADGTSEAERIAATHGIDVVLSDYRLREGDSGLRVLTRVLELQPMAKAALITGDTAPDRIAEAQAAGVPLFHKPVAVANLLELLQRHRAPARDQNRVVTT
jgi:signal transduction histidine kinase/ActR/RegA family two-component response regulator